MAVGCMHLGLESSSSSTLNPGLAMPPSWLVKSMLDAMVAMVKVDPDCNASSNTTFSSGGAAHLRQHGRLVKHLKQSLIN